MKILISHEKNCTSKISLEFIKWWYNELWLMRSNMRLNDCMNRLSGRLGKIQEVPSGYRFRCPYCGDSQKSQSKARGHVVEKSGKRFLPQLRTLEAFWSILEGYGRWAVCRVCQSGILWKASRRRCSTPEGGRGCEASWHSSFTQRWMQGSSILESL